SKFDLKLGYWQIQIEKKDQYKTAFNVPIGHYEWKVMHFGLKNAPSEIQQIMNDIFIPYSEFIIVYIDDILVFSKDIETHFKHLEIFKKLVIQNGLVISKSKMPLF
ncbi:RNA-directed DNA polymerase, partial [Salmonella enterica subsp. enterica serovar Typhi]|nr:RNA-directed DNA polymerase [Salmonella enterica subsp. enterica serovar Typhi]